MLACDLCTAELEASRPARSIDDMARGGCKHASTRPPADAGCPWCRVEEVEWKLIGMTAQFEAAKKQIEDRDYRIFALISRSGPV
jgi:hypothetical protein